MGCDARFLFELANRAGTLVIGLDGSARHALRWEATVKKKPFEPGDKVRTPTGENAVVRRQFIDGSVTFRFERGGYGEADHKGLTPLPTSPRKRG